MKTIPFSRVIHLSHVISPDVPCWPGDPPVEFSPVATLDQHGYYLRRFSMGEHTATHINAPSSFHPDAPGIDSYPPESFIIPAVCIDVHSRAQSNPDYSLTIQDILNWETPRRPIPEGVCVLLHTGWNSRWDNPRAFLNLDPRGIPHTPGVPLETARFLIDERKIGGLGTDAPGIDPGADVQFNTNRLLLEKQRIVLENLTSLDQLPDFGATLFIGALQLARGAGSPVSVLALLP